MIYTGQLSTSLIIKYKSYMTQEFVKFYLIICRSKFLSVVHHLQYSVCVCGHMCICLHMSTYVHTYVFAYKHLYVLTLCL